MLRLHSGLSPPRSRDFCFDRTASFTEHNPGETLCILMCALEATSADENENITKATQCHDLGISLSEPCFANAPVNLEVMSLNRAQALSALKFDSTTGIKLLNRDAVSLSEIIWSLEEDFYKLIKNPQDAGDDDFSVTSDLFDDDDLTMKTDEMPTEIQVVQTSSTLNCSGAEVYMDLEQSDPIIYGHADLRFSTVSNENLGHHVGKPGVQSDPIAMLKTSIPLDENVLQSRMRPLMEKSIESQEALQDWDRLNGLPASHSKTMVNTSRSRTQLLEGIILRKWDGSPLIPFVGESGRPA